MWSLSLPWWEFVLRALIVYAFLMVLLRLTGKRQVGQLAPFDLVLLLVLSNAVQNSMNGGDNTVTAGIILSATLVGANAARIAVSFSVDNATALFAGANNIVLPTLSGPMSDASSFDWGLPFFYGRRVFIGIDGQSSALGTGPYFAF